MSHPTRWTWWTVYDCPLTAAQRRVAVPHGWRGAGDKRDLFLQLPAENFAPTDSPSSLRKIFDSPGAHRWLRSGQWRDYRVRHIWPACCLRGGHLDPPTDTRVTTECVNGDSLGGRGWPHTAVLPKIPHSNSCKRVPNRPLRPRIHYRCTK